MQRASKFVRQIFSAALLLSPFSALAETKARFDAALGAIIVSGMVSKDTSLLLNDPSLIRLQNAATPEASGMLVALEEVNGEVQIKPRFSLQTSTRYAFSINWPNAAPFSTEFTLNAVAAAAPDLVAFSPQQSLIPANTLRFYLSFSEPMARGQVRDSISLVRGDGQIVDSPFLNLATELWDGNQKRLTLLLDPGRIKQGVGPNAIAGAPLVEGQRYQLVVSGKMKSAKGAVLGSDRRAVFEVGPPERHAIDPQGWDIATPHAGSTLPFTLTFDRIIDSGAALRLLSLIDPNGAEISGTLYTDGGGWSLTPSTPWEPGYYQLLIDPELEDVAGNTIRAAFDATAGIIGSTVPEASIYVHID
ncbi:MAG: Ig-like domain-containing protein [Paracoccaceae bacterium]|jgi:hypothetical protein|nr:Ig-like domain-containing protein [Rhodobacterales bacterium FZCC0083]